jgi:hypothetical protein
MNTAPVPSPFSADRVLQVLARQMAGDGWGLNFDLFEEYASRAGARLSVFRSRDGLWWVLCIETVYLDRGGEDLLGVYLYGNCLRKRKNERGDLERELFVTPEGGSFPDGDSNYGQILRSEFSILRHGRHVTFKPSPEQYAKCGLKWNEYEEASGTMSQRDALRFLCYEYGDGFFASEDCLRDLMQNRRDSKAPYSLTHELELFLQTQNWTHPEWDFDIEAPSIEAFRVLAEAIVSGDLSDWDKQDPAVFNSHWSNWGEYGSEKKFEQLFAEAEAAVEAAAVALDESLQVLAPEDRAAFEKEARHRYGGAVKPSKKPSRTFTFEQLIWQFGEHTITATPDILRAWLRLHPKPPKPPQPHS